MLYKRLPPLKYLQECFEYSKKTGALLWKVRPLYHFCNASTATSINKRRAGTPALACPDTNGYLSGIIGGASHRANRIIWKLVTGKTPKKEVEHKNRIKTDNRWNNLRLATRSQNVQNRSVAVNNTSGYAGISFNKNEQKWKVYIKPPKQKRLNLGTFSDIKEASLIRRRAEKLYFGEFAP